MIQISTLSLGRLLFACLSLVLVMPVFVASAFAAPSGQIRFPEPTWEHLTRKVKEAKESEIDGDIIERWLLRSVDLLVDTSVTWDQLGEFLELLEERQKTVSHTSFQSHRLLAFRSAWSRLRHNVDELGLPEAHALLVHSQNRYPDDLTLVSYQHERFAHFSLLAGLFQRAREKSTPPLGANADEWTFLEGRAFAFVQRGGELQLREFLEKTGGDSPFAELALVTLREFLMYWARDEELRAEVNASIADLEVIVRAGISRRDKKGRSGPDHKATGLYPFGEWIVMMEEDLFGANVSVYNWNGRLTSRRTFRSDELESLGGYSGLFVPTAQPKSDLFLINKYGSYAGVTLIVNNRGQLLEFPGGAFAFDASSRFLFLREETDTSGLYTVLDPTLRLIAASNDPTALRDDTGKKIRVPTSFSTDPR